MITPVALALALALDAWLGEPEWLWSRVPHPAVLMGRLIGWSDRHFNPGGKDRGRGIFALVGFCALTWIIGSLIVGLPGGPILEVIAAAILLAQRSLADHVTAVAEALERSLAEARTAVGQIVGRDTGQMEESDIARAAIESAAENLSDAVVAPAFWFLLGGLPALLLYKMINTADSMIGYRTERHLGFGWASARLDDLLNWVPARLTALMIAALYGGISHWQRIVTDAQRHRSPNAGWPEAAMARALGVALSGPRRYHGQLTEDPFVHPEGRKALGAKDIRAAVAVLWRVWGLLLVLCVAAALGSWLA
ncbi:MAG: adenosylcobinamide-phosphate synthase CbiB [Pseudomonadota bacterium]